MLLIAAGFFNLATYAAPKAFASAYMDSVLQMSTPLIGTVTSLAMVASILGSLTSSRLARRFGATQTPARGPVPAWCSACCCWFSPVRASW